MRPTWLARSSVICSASSDPKAVSLYTAKESSTARCQTTRSLNEPLKFWLSARKLLTICYSLLLRGQHWLLSAYCGWIHLRIQKIRQVVHVLFCADHRRHELRSEEHTS